MIENKYLEVLPVWQWWKCGENICDVILDPDTWTVLIGGDICDFLTDRDVCEVVIGGNI